MSGWKRSSMQPQTDKLEKSFNLDPVIQQIDHLLQSQSSLLAPLLFARVAQRLCSHPPLWLSGESLSGFSSAVEPTTAAQSSATELRVGTLDLPFEAAYLWHCPRCDASMIVIQRFTAEELSACTYFDSS